MEPTGPAERQEDGIQNYILTFKYEPYGWRYHIGNNGQFIDEIVIELDQEEILLEFLQHSTEARVAWALNRIQGHGSPSASRIVLLQQFNAYKANAPQHAEFLQEQAILWARDLCLRDSELKSRHMIEQGLENGMSFFAALNHTQVSPPP